MLQGKKARASMSIFEATQKEARKKTLGSNIDWLAMMQTCEANCPRGSVASVDSSLLFY